jgi:alkanesulfonate monooxygenase SsuD/methylene tetrahydromethanopterin reductase-like flavin-dependent oxidoreductase (luciferase family)
LSKVGDVAAALRAAAEAAGRDGDSIDFGCMIPLCIADDHEKARSAVRHVLAFHISNYRFYRSHFARVGYEHVVRRVLDATATGESGAVAAVIPDELVDQLAAVGSAADCEDMLETYRAAGVTLPIIYPLHVGFTRYQPEPSVVPSIHGMLEALGDE